MVLGSRSGSPSGGPKRPPDAIPVRAATARRRCCGVWTGGWADRRGWMTRNAHGLSAGRARSVSSMQSITPSHPGHRASSLIVGTILGGCLVALGLGIALFALQTPLATSLVPQRPGSGVALAVIVWALTLVAGGALLVAGTNRLAAIVATVRSGPRPLSSVAAAFGSVPEDIAVMTNVVPTEGRPIPEIVVGPFGVAVIHELGPKKVIRQVGTSWERKTRDGWVPTEHPLDTAERDAERVRHWMTHGDLDFVVRVYAALITADPSMLRSPLCAVITEDRIPDWIASLPRQRTLSEGRRQQIVARVRGAVATGGSRRDW